MLVVTGFTLLATGRINSALSAQTITLQSTGIQTTAAALTRSADILSLRLKSFGAGKSEVRTVPEKGQIQVILAETKDLNQEEKLLTQPGKLRFYETFDQQSVSELLKGDRTLFRLLKSDAEPGTLARLGCVRVSETGTVNQYLTMAGLEKKCRFAWDDLFDGSEACLFALKMGADSQIPLSDTSVQSFECKLDPVRNSYYIEFKFRQPAIGIWADVTRRNLSKPIALVLDDKVIFAPVVNSEIKGGNCQISGNFTASELQYITAVLSGGELLLNLVVVK